MVYNLAKWNGSVMSVCGTPNDYVTSLGVYNNELYAGGNFSNVGGATAYFIAKYNGTSWSSVGSVAWSGVSPVFAFSTFNTDLIVGGFMYSANYIADWNGSTWTGLSSGTNNIVYALSVYNNELYAAGTFTTAGGASANRIANRIADC